MSFTFVLPGVFNLRAVTEGYAGAFDDGSVFAEETSEDTPCRLFSLAVVGAIVRKGEKEPNCGKQDYHMRSFTAVEKRCKGDGTEQRAICDEMPQCPRSHSSFSISQSFSHFCFSHFPNIYALIYHSYYRLLTQGNTHKSQMLT